MFLKNVTMRGFKSFADRTVLDLEPGITVIVGPNGSGKSNIVDALTWVLGSASPKSLRGGAMSDVVFAGSGPAPSAATNGRRREGRPAQGRASVEITIDNTSGLLPIDFTEVTLGRAMFTTGEGSYAINGTDCRLLDVSELLSDTGLGRENHTIVGQGQLDAVLSAGPLDRRAFIEEAAGILKHRRRKERALRKLAQMEGHLERLTDILRELKRQLKPLERQAEAAGKHAQLSAALREVRVVRALRELVALTDAHAQHNAAVSASEQALAALEARLAQARATEGGLEQTLGTLALQVRAAAEVHFRLANLTERARGLTERVEERRAGLADAVEEPVAGRDPSQLHARAEVERGELAAVAVEQETARRALAGAAAQRQAAEQARRAHEQAAALAARQLAEARERLLRWEGRLAAVRSSLAQGAGEEHRLVSQIGALEARIAGMTAGVDSGQAELGRLDAQVHEHAASVERARGLVAERAAALAALTDEERRLERERAALEARADTLRAPAGEGPAGTAVLAQAAAQGRVPGLLGPLTDHIRIAEHAALAIAAALGPLQDALVAEDPAAAGAAVRFAVDTARGAVLLLAAKPAPAPAAGSAPAAADAPAAAAASAAAASAGIVGEALRAAGGVPATEAVEGDPRVVAALAGVLGGTWIAPDLRAAAELAANHPGLQFVSRSGELAGPRGYAGGAGGPGGAVVRQAARAEAERRREVCGNELADVAARAAAAHQARDDASGALGEAEAERQRLAAARSAAAARLDRSRSELDGARRERELRRGEASALASELAEHRARLAALEGQEAEVAAPARDAEQAPGGDPEAERLEDVLAATREAETTARLAVGAADQSESELRRRLSALESEAVDVERRLAERERRRVARLDALARCRQIAAVAVAARERCEASLALAAAARDRGEEARGGQQRDLGAVRARLRDLDAERATLVGERHAEDLCRSELAQALAQVRARLAEELDVEPDAALVEVRARPLDDPGSPLAGGEERDAELAETEARLARRVELLGPVNPLALEEFRAAADRHTFLSDQLDDLRASRRDLEQVIAAVDTRIEEVFGAAFRDVAEHFTRVFGRLFPGGEGRLVLTDPDDLLGTGVEVEARPAGKRVKRLSLLSGGERSLTALAVLFAIFAARPSPFYVLDEVEAALDDVNLTRFLDVLADFKRTAQLIVITHQRRTMEIADTLYGVAMRDDGVSRVVGQRLVYGAVHDLDELPEHALAAAYR